jgi:hypothetical protein
VAKVTRATAAAAAAAVVEGAAEGALAIGASPGGSTGRGGKQLPAPADLTEFTQFFFSCHDFFFLLPMEEMLNSVDIHLKRILCSNHQKYFRDYLCSHQFIL